MTLVVAFLRELLEWVRGHVREAWVNNAAALASLYVAALVATYGYVRWRYGVSPSVDQYFQSYLFKETTAVFFGLVALGLVLRPRAVKSGKDARGRLASAWLWMRQVGLRRAALAGLVLVLMIASVVWWMPRRAGQIRVAFLGEPDFDMDAFAYLVYEFNRTQGVWHLDVDFEVLDEGILSGPERTACGDNPVCVVELLGGGRPTIAVSARPLGDATFWMNQGATSVVSTVDWKRFEPPSRYEYLAHAVVVQSVLIHLNASCRGLRRDAFEKSWASKGGLFEATPHRRAMKAALMAAYLGADDEELLTNCFGIDYAANVSRMLSLDWLHEKRVRENLERGFGVRL